MKWFLQFLQFWVLPLFLGINDIGHMSLLVPFVIIIGITATDRSLSQQMIERGSGVVVAGILFAQIIAAGNETPYVFTGLIESSEPFGLTFWLWMSLLIGWFAPTAMLRTPAMPIALPLALILLSSEAALIGWFVGIIAFIYLETREQARDWVVRSTYAATVIAWWITIIIGSENEMCSVFIGSINGDVIFNVTEIESIRFIDCESLEQEMHLNSDHTPWFKMEWTTIKDQHPRELEKYI